MVKGTATTKRKHQTQPPSASTNGGEASRVIGALKKGSYTTKQRLTDSTNYMPVSEPFLNTRRETRRPH